MSRRRTLISQCSGRTSQVHFLRVSPVPLFSRQTSILHHVHNPILYVSYVAILKTFHSTVDSSYSPFLVHTGKLFKSTSYCKRHCSFYTSRLIFKDFSILKTTFYNTEYIYKYIWYIFFRDDCYHSVQNLLSSR